MNAVERRLHSKIQLARFQPLWFSPQYEALQALVTETQRDVTGLVRLKLYKGNIIVGGRKSDGRRYVCPPKDGFAVANIRPERRDWLHSSQCAPTEAARGKKGRSVERRGGWTSPLFACVDVICWTRCHNNEMIAVGDPNFRIKTFPLDVKKQIEL